MAILPRGLRESAVLVALLVSGCTAAQNPEPQPSVAPASSAPRSVVLSPPPPAPTLSPTSIASAAVATAPARHAGHGPAPIFPEPVAVTDATFDTDAGALLETARARLTEAVSFRYWTSKAGGGPAADDLDPSQPLIMAGSVEVAASPRAAWGLTNLAGYAGRTIQYTVIDGTVWCDSGIGFWTVFEGADADLALADAAVMQPHSFFGPTFLDASTDFRVAGLDRIGERTAIRFEAHRPHALAIQGWWAGMQGEVKRFALWVAEDGTPLQSEVTGVVQAGHEAGEFRDVVQIDGLDDPEIDIEPPI